MTLLSCQLRKKMLFLKDARNFYMLVYSPISIKKKSKLHCHEPLTGISSVY